MHTFGACGLNGNLTVPKRGHLGAGRVLKVYCSAIGVCCWAERRAEGDGVTPLGRPVASANL